MLFGKKRASDAPKLPRPKRESTGNIIEDTILGLDRPNRPPREPGPTFEERWISFKGTDSTASVVFGCASIITTIILAIATMIVTIRANELLDRQNDLILSSALPAVNASLVPVDSGGFVLTVENTGPRANFRSIELMSLVRFSFENFEGSVEDGYIAVYDVFPDIRLNQVSGTGTLASISSVPSVTPFAEEICEIITGADSRVSECGLEFALVVRYQTNSDELYRNYYRFDDGVSIQISAEELDHLLDRWDDGPNDRSAFSISSSPPEDMLTWVDEYVDQQT